MICFVQPNRTKSGSGDVATGKQLHPELTKIEKRYIKNIQQT